MVKKSKSTMKEVNKKPEMGPMPNKAEMAMMGKMPAGMPPKGMGKGIPANMPKKGKGNMPKKGGKMGGKK